FFFGDTATPPLYPLSLHDALPILLAYMHRHSKGGPFVAGLPHAGQPGSLLKRFVGTPLEGRVIAKTGSIDRVNSLSGYIEPANGDRKSTRLNSSHVANWYAVFRLK